MKGVRINNIRCDAVFILTSYEGAKCMLCKGAAAGECQSLGINCKKTKVICISNQSPEPSFVLKLGNKPWSKSYPSTLTAYRTFSHQNFHRVILFCSEEAWNFSADRLNVLYKQSEKVLRRVKSSSTRSYTAS